MHQEIEELIQMALVDGVVSEKDSKIIIQKAIELKIDNIELSELKKLLKEYEQKRKLDDYNKKTKCPNCGAKINEKTTNCEYCNFLIADEKELKKIDDFILKLEKNILEFNEYSQISLSKLILIFVSILSLTYYYIYNLASNGTIMLIFYLVIPLLLGLYIWNKIKKKNKIKYDILKQKFQDNINDFSEYYPKNKKLKEIRYNFEQRHVKRKKEFKNKIAKASVISVLIFSVILFLFYSFKNVLEEEKYTNQDVEFTIKEVIYESSANITSDDIKILNRSFNASFKQDYSFESQSFTDVILNLDKIKIKINNSFLNKIDTSNKYIIFHFSFEIGTFVLMDSKHQKKLFFIKQDLNNNNGVLFLNFFPSSKMDEQEAIDCIKSLKKSKDISLVIKIEEVYKNN